MIVLHTFVVSGSRTNALKQVEASNATRFRTCHLERMLMIEYNSKRPSSPPATNFKKKGNILLCTERNCSRGMLFDKRAPEINVIHTTDPNVMENKDWYKNRMNSRNRPGFLSMSPARIPRGLMKSKSEGFKSPTRAYQSTCKLCLNM